MLNIYKSRKDVRYSGPDNPLVTTAADVKDLYRNTTTGEIFTCTDTVDKYSWIGTLGTEIPIKILEATNSNLLAMYTMDNISGSTLVDESGNRNGSIVGTTTTPGLIGDDMQFGSPTYIDLGPTPLINGSTNFEICMWLYGNTSTGCVYSQYSPAFGASSRLQIVKVGNYIVLQAGASGSVSSSGGMGTGWNLCTMYREGATFGVTINGVLNNTGPGGYIYQTGTLLGARSNSEASYLSSLTNFYTGEMDQVRIFNRVLTVNERQQLYNEGIPA